jgi:NADH-quinone oxidoreductase subunit L
MTYPLVILAVCTVLLGVVGTPVWPWFHDFLSGHGAGGMRAVPAGVLGVMLFSSLVALGGIGLGWWLYGRKPSRHADDPDVLETWQPDLFTLLRRKFYVDELYEMSVIQWNAAWSKGSDWFDRVIWTGLVQGVALLVLMLSWLNRLVDEFVVNLGFDKGCELLRRSGGRLSWLQNGRVQRYLRVVGLALAVFVLLSWVIH